MSASPLSPTPVLFIDHTARLGGGEVALLNLLTSLDRTRYAPSVLLFGDGPLREALARIDIPTRVLPLASTIADARKDTLGRDTLFHVRDGLRTMAFVWTVRRAIRASGARLVYTNSLKSDFIGGLAARLAGVPVVWHMRDRIADDYLPPRVVGLVRFFARRLPTALIANSHATLETLGPLTPGDPPRLGRRPAWVVHDGTPVPPVAPPAAPLPVAPPERGDAPVVGLVGRLAPWKGQHVFIDAAARVRWQFPHARFRLIGSALFGEDDYVRQLHATVDALGLADAVEFCGHRTDIAATLADLDLLVHASITGEPFGQVIIEGMAAGRAVVATRGGGVPEIVSDGNTGLLVPMGDAAAMAAAIERLLADPATRTAMGQCGRQRVLERFTIAHTAAGVQDVFDRVLGKRV